ncbi:MAG TPA: MFS transporter [Thermoplasmata archaeon]|nr:MFS transporter [Thermoplasmata archaeon]
MGAVNDVETRVRRYYAFEILVAFQLWSPFWSLWLFDRLHNDYFLGTLVDVVFWIVSLLVAMPTGAFADRYGRKRAVVIGVGIWMVGIVLFGLAGDFASFALANSVWAFGAGFLWGAGSAYLYDTLVEVHAEARYPSVSGQVAMYAFLGTALASVCGGVIVASTGGLNLPLVLYAIPGAGALILGLSFQEPSVPREPEPDLLRQVAAGFRSAAGNRQIVLVIVFQLIVGFVTYMMGFFRPRFLDQVVQGNFALLGAIYAGFFLIAALAGRTVGRLLERFGESGGLIVVFLLVYPPFALIYLVAQGFFAPNLALVLGVLTQIPDYIFWGIESPLITTIINRRVASNDRATVLAINSFFGTLVIAIAEPAVGLAATAYSFGTGLGLAALAAALPSALVLVSYRRSERSTPQLTPAAQPARDR